MIDKDMIGRWRVRYARGTLYTTIPMTLFSALSLSLLWIPYLREFGIPTWIVYIGAPFGFLGLTLYAGYWDETKKMWERETAQFYCVSNPQAVRSYRQIDSIEELLERIEKRL